MRLAYPSVSPHHSNGDRWYWNLNQLSITYGVCPRLRSRLTLSGRSFLRKPWVFGGRDSHPSFRYSYRHSHFHTLQHSSRYTFNVYGTLPYHLGSEMWEVRCGIRVSPGLTSNLSPPTSQIHSFGDELEPRWIIGAEPLDQ